MISRAVRFPVAPSVAAALGCIACLATQPGCLLISATEDTKIASIEVFGNSEVAVGSSITLHTIRKNAAGSTISLPGSITWSSSNPTVATVSADGVVTGVQEGTVTIVATSGNVSGSKAILVTESVGAVASVTVSGPSSIRARESGGFQALLRDAGGHTVTRPVAWSSSDVSKASVDPTTGVVTGVAVGTVTITATSEGKSGSAQLTITPAAVAVVAILGPNTVAIGESVLLTAQLYDAALTPITDPRTVTWSSSDPTKATVNDGQVTGIAAGTTTITATCEGKSATLLVTISAGGNLRLSGRVIDYTNGNGLGGATVTVFRADLTGGALASATTAADGTFLTGGFIAPVGGVLVEGASTGYVTGRILVTSGLTGTGSVPTEPIPLVPTSSAKGAISGVVRNARTGAAIPGASLALYSNFTSAPVAAATADANGIFTFSDLSAGTYRVAATAPNFQLSERVGIAVGNNGVTGGQDLVLSPSGTNDIRIVLTWGSTPGDLDSHLTGPDGASRFHVYYASRGNFTAAPFAGLDIDDINGHGPETISITQVSPGNYRYSVHDFTNRNSAGSTALGNSGAKVRVYSSTALLLEAPVPTGAGNLWTVFEMTGTLANPVITRRDELSFASDPAGIPAPPALKAGGTDADLIARAVRRAGKERF